MSDTIIRFCEDFVGAWFTVHAYDTRVAIGRRALMPHVSEARVSRAMPDAGVGAGVPDSSEAIIERRPGGGPRIFQMTRPVGDVHTPLERFQACHEAGWRR